MVQTHNPGTSRMRQKDCQFEVSLGDIARLCLRDREERGEEERVLERNGKGRR